MVEMILIAGLAVVLGVLRLSLLELTVFSKSVTSPRKFGIMFWNVSNKML